MKTMKRGGMVSKSGDSRRRRAVLCGLALLAFSASQSAAVRAGTPESGTPSQTAASELAAKIAMLSEARPRGSGPLQPVTITDHEATSYLRLRGHEFLPPALQSPEIHIQPEQIAGAAEVDFDELGQMGEKSDDWGAKLVGYVFKGKQHVTATGTLETGNGQGKFTLTGLTVGSTSLPAGFVNFLLQSYMERQYKIDLSKPFPLPPNVTHIELASGRATLRRNALSRR